MTRIFHLLLAALILIIISCGQAPTKKKKIGISDKDFDLKTNFVYSRSKDNLPNLAPKLNDVLKRGRSYFD